MYVSIIFRLSLLFFLSAKLQVIIFFAKNNEKKYSYCRVSTEQQDMKRQIDYELVDKSFVRINAFSYLCVN